ncbi:hypothetical protein MNBD_NITROSPIRAE01-994 [hydrothermal vent metagenome]|uniref:PpiC domain-containing protein n=1 Tax=hydrothermal vent metagenome TaxID=652676 RepID=A0A3B1D427_9ZZZZ
MQKIRILVSLLLLTHFFSAGDVLFAGEGETLAIVGGVPITKDLFEKRMSRLTNEQQGDFTTYEMKKELLDMLIATEVLHQEGVRRGLDKDAAIQAQVKEFLESILVREVVNLINRDVITDVNMKAYYKKNLAMFGEVRANHVLVKTEKEALEVKTKLAGGADFATIAKEVSIDPASAARGGDLGFFTKDRMVEPFSKVAFALKKGEISNPVKSPFGFHIIQKVESREPGAFESLTPTQVQNMRGIMINAEIDMLKDKAKISVNDKALRAAASTPAEPHGH